MQPGELAARLCQHEPGVQIRRFAIARRGSLLVLAEAQAQPGQVSSHWARLGVRAPSVEMGGELVSPVDGELAVGGAEVHFGALLPPGTAAPQRPLAL